MPDFGRVIFGVERDGRPASFRLQGRDTTKVRIGQQFCAQFGEFVCQPLRFVDVQLAEHEVIRAAFRPDNQLAPPREQRCVTGFIHKVIPNAVCESDKPSSSSDCFMARFSRIR